MDQEEAEREQVDRKQHSGEVQQEPEFITSDGGNAIEKANQKDPARKKNQELNAPTTTRKNNSAKTLRTAYDARPDSSSSNNNKHKEKQASERISIGKKTQRNKPNQA